MYLKATVNQSLAILPVITYRILAEDNMSEYVEHIPPRASSCDEQCDQRR